MNDSKKPTSYHDINIVLNLFLNQIKKILGNHFIGMYLYGSLAMGDFNKNTSDIDFIVITLYRTYFKITQRLINDLL